MAKKNKKNEEEQPRVNPELNGFNIKINSFGEILGNYNIEQINEFLNRHVDDKKLRDRDDLDLGQPKSKKSNLASPDSDVENDDATDASEEALPADPELTETLDYAEHADLPEIEAELEDDEEERPSVRKSNTRGKAGDDPEALRFPDEG